MWLVIERFDCQKEKGDILILFAFHGLAITNTSFDRQLQVSLIVQHKKHIKVSQLI